MFKLVVLFAVVAVAAAKPAFLATVPAITRTASVITGPTTIESHGNSVAHATAPITTSIVSPAIVESRSILPAVAPAAPLISSYSAPLLSSSFYGSPLIAGGYGFNSFNSYF